MPSFLNDQRMAALELTKRRLEQSIISTAEKASIETKLNAQQTSWMSWLLGYFLF